MKRYFLLSLLFFFCGLTQATISTQISHSSVQMGDTFRVTFTVDAPQTDSIPDLTPFQQNFAIVGTERSMAYSIVNGERHSLHQWIVLLSPQKTGVLLIPAIQIGQEQSTASSIEVLGASDRRLPEKKEPAYTDQLMLKTELSQPDPFINQQVIYTVKLYSRQRLLDAEYQPPTIDDALLIPLGHGRHYQRIIDDHNYAVEEQQYAIFPQKSGELTITPPIFRALIFDSVPRRMTARTSGKTLMVKPVPPDYAGKHWFPAKQAALTEVYDQQKTTVTEGNTLIRTVTLQAAGVPAELLPTIALDKGDGFNSYPEKPELKNSIRQQELMGRADIKITYLLNEAGKITLPAIHVPWYNTLTGKEEILSLPEHVLDVKVKDAETMPIARPTHAPKSQRLSKLNPSLNLPVKTSFPLAWWLAGGFALAWLTTLVLWWYRRKLPITKVSHEPSPLKAVHAACKNNDPSRTQQALLHWARLQWPSHRLFNLHDLEAVVLCPHLKIELSNLSKVLYSADKNLAWQGDLLWQYLSNLRQKKIVPQHKNHGLPPINP